MFSGGIESNKSSQDGFGSTVTLQPKYTIKLHMKKDLAIKNHTRTKGSVNNSWCLLFFYCFNPYGMTSRDNEVWQLNNQSDSVIYICGPLQLFFPYYLDQFLNTKQLKCMVTRSNTHHLTSVVSCCTKSSMCQTSQKLLIISSGNLVLCFSYTSTGFDYIKFVRYNIKVLLCYHHECNC